VPTRKTEFEELIAAFLNACEEEFELIWDGNPETAEAAEDQAYKNVWSAERVLVSRLKLPKYYLN